MKILVVGSKHYASFLREDILNDNLEILEYNNIFQIKEADIVLFTGGEDVDPSLYGEKPHFLTHYNRSRDIEEIKIFDEAVKDSKFLIGVCRGAQFLTVMSGGSLIQHVNNHTSTHEILTHDFETFKVTSTHHQMMYPFRIGHTLLAYSKNPLSNVYFRNSYHMYDNKEMPCEPEVIFIPTYKAFCIQPHPESMDRNSNFVIWLNKEILKAKESSILKKQRLVQSKIKPTFSKEAENLITEIELKNYDEFFNDLETSYIDNFRAHLSYISADNDKLHINENEPQEEIPL